MSQGEPGSSQFNLNAAPFQPGGLRVQTANNRAGTSFNPDAAPWTPSSALSGPTDSSSFSSPVPAPTDSKSIPLLGGFRSTKRGQSASPDNGAMGNPSAYASGGYGGSPNTVPVMGASSMQRSVPGPVDDAPAPPPRQAPPAMNWIPPQLRKQAAMRPMGPTMGASGQSPQTPRVPVAAPTQAPPPPQPQQQQHATPPPTSSVAVPMPRTASAQLANASTAASTGEMPPTVAAPGAPGVGPVSTGAEAARAPPPARPRAGMYPVSMSSRTPAPRSQASAAAAAAVATSDASAMSPPEPQARVSTAPPTAPPAPAGARAEAANGYGPAMPRASPPPSSEPARPLSHTPVPLAARPAAPASLPLKTWVPPQMQRMERLKQMAQAQARHEDPAVAPPEPEPATSSSPTPPPTQSVPETAPVRRPPTAPRDPAQPAPVVPAAPLATVAPGALPPRTGSAPLVKSFQTPDPLSRIHRGGGLAGPLPSRPPAGLPTSPPALPAMAATDAAPSAAPSLKREIPAPSAARPSAAAPTTAAPAPVAAPSAPVAMPPAQPPQPAPRPLPTQASLGSHVGATPYAPKNWVPPQRQRVANLAKVQPSPTTPLVVLILGNRGSGKTTQGQALATRYNLLHLSSGNLFREGKKPYEELEEAVKKYFVDTSKCPYNGLVLDRFIVSSAADAFFVQHALNLARLPVPIVFWLKVNPAVGVQRATAQSSTKQGLDYWRLVEQCAQASVVHQIYEPIGRVFTIDTEAFAQEQVASRIVDFIEMQFARLRLDRASLPSISPIPCDPDVTIMDSHPDFVRLTHNIHDALVSRGRHDSAPLSAIGGYVDETFFSDKNMKLNRRAYFVTPKVDGHRFLVVKHKVYGFVGVPAQFNSCFNFNSLFKGQAFSTPPRDQLWPPVSEDNPVEVVLDTELAIDAQGVPMLHVIDYVYFYGNIAIRQVFPVRYEALKHWFAAMRADTPREVLARPSVVLKDYVPIRDLGQLLTSLERVSFKIDGIVFQHSKKYLYGLDKALLKWKPQNQCTADFRLANGRDLQDGTWLFDLNVSAPKDALTLEEVPYAGATATFSDQEMSRNHLQNAVVVELSLEHVDKETGASQWKFCRVRADKPSPNKHSIVNYILSLKHMTYEELVKLCAAIK